MERLVFRGGGRHSSFGGGYLNVGSAGWFKSYPGRWVSFKMLVTMGMAIFFLWYGNLGSVECLNSCSGCWVLKSYMGFWVS